MGWMRAVNGFDSIFNVSTYLRVESSHVFAGLGILHLGKDKATGIS